MFQYMQEPMPASLTHTLWPTPALQAHSNCSNAAEQPPPCLTAGKIHWRNTFEQLKLVGPKSLGVALLTAGFVGMVFTIQFVREFAKLGLTRSVGGVLGLALVRELTPVVTAIILAGRVGSAFAAELGTMQARVRIFIQFALLCWPHVVSLVSPMLPLAGGGPPHVGFCAEHTVVVRT